MAKKNKSKKSSTTQILSPVNVDDEELMDDLLAELDSRDQTVQTESAAVLQEITESHTVVVEEPSSQTEKQDAKGRFRARQARKLASLEANYSKSDPELEARIASETKAEEESIMATCEKLGVYIHEVNPDGHCLFSAIADQLALLSIISSSQANYVTTRLAAANYIYSHPDDFLPFLPSVDGEDGIGSLDAGLMSPKDFEKYCKTIGETNTWGGEPEILALSRAFGVPIHVVQGGNPPIVVHNPNETFPTTADSKSKAVRISYHRRMYGLGEHYNSLRPKSLRSQISHAVQNVLS